MKLSSLIGITLFMLVTAGCGNDNNSVDSHTGGWYLISDTNEIMDDAIFTKYDVEVIWIDSSYMGDTKTKVYEVVGKFTSDATVRLSEFTEKNIGKRLGFVLDGKIITSPVIEQKNDDGKFSIISVPLFTNKAKAHEVYESLLVEY